MVSTTTSFGVTVRTKNGRVVTPDWKTAMLRPLRAVPDGDAAVEISRSLLDHVGAPPMVGDVAGQVISVAALQWAPCRGWADGFMVAGSDRWPRTAGEPYRCGALVLGYAATLVVFATVQELQYWDYGPE